MTTPNELERLARAVIDAETETSFHYAREAFAEAAPQILSALSERAELLATVERMRGGLTNAAAALGKAAEIFGGYGHNITARVMSMEAQEARADLTTGEEK